MNVAASTPAFVDLRQHLVPYLKPHAVFHHRASLTGRERLLDLLLEFLTVEPDRSRVVLVAGPGGQGKSRLVVEALRRVEQREPLVLVRVFQERRSLDDAAVAELPRSGAVILIEDAHRHADELAPLLDHAHRVPGTVVVLTIRGSSSAVIEAAVAQAGFAGSEVADLRVDPLSTGAAQALVDELIKDGPEFRAEFVEYLAQEARDCPLIPILAVGMAREKALSPGLFVLDQNFREQVLRAYALEVAGTVPGGIDPAVVTAVGAVVSAVAPFPIGDQDLLAAVARFVEMSVDHFVWILQVLIQAGLIVAPNGRARVFPDIVADEMLARAVALEGQDSGYAGRLWTALGATSASARLVTNLAELSWRLVRTGGPDIFAPVWPRVVAGVDLNDVDELDGAVGDLAILADLQPHRLFGLLRDVLATAEAAQDSREIGVASSASDASVVMRRAVDRLVGLLARCALADHALLPMTLDELWSLAARDSQPWRRTENHPAHVIQAKLASFASEITLEDAAVIVDRVEAWLDEPDAPQTPVIALEGLMAKSGLRTGWLRNGVSLTPFAVAVEQVGDLRERIRRVLIREAQGADVRRAADAVRLLGAALDPPDSFGRSTWSLEVVLAWENDDVATLTALSEVAHTTTEPVVRRLVRQKVAWHARSAESQAVRDGALSLATDLDQREDDDLAEALLGGYELNLSSRRGLPMPAGGAPRATAGTDTPSGDVVQRNRDLLYERAVVALWRDRDPAEIVNLLDQSVRTVRLVTETGSAAGATTLLLRLARQRPGQMPDLLDAAVRLPEGPLDDYLHLLLDAWARHDLDTFCPAAASLSRGRPGIRRALARGFRTGSWALLDPRLADLQRETLRHTDDPVERSLLLGALGPLIRADPGSVRALLGDVPEDGSPGLAAGLAEASNDEPENWIASLDHAQVQAVLELTQLAGWGERPVQLIVAAIARRQPRAVLDALTAIARGNRWVPDVEGLSEALDEHPDSIATWLADLLTMELGPPLQRAELLEAAFGPALTTGAARAVGELVVTLRPEPLQRLLGGLRHCDELVVSHPTLIAVLVERIESIPHAATRREARASLLDLSFPVGAAWHRPGDVPVEYTDRRTRLAAIAADETLPAATAAFYRDATRSLDATIAAEKRRSQHGDE